MTIDWFTVIAQAINFIILLWLMKHFLYKPILNAIDKREKRIAEELANAETEKAAAEKQKVAYDLKTEHLDWERNAFLKKAEDEGKAEKQRLLKEARETADALSKKRKELLITEETNLREAVSRKIQNEVLATTRKVLEDLAGANLEERVVEVFIQLLHDLDASSKVAITSALKNDPGVVTVRTALDISPDLRISIETSINEIIGSQPDISFESAPGLINGIELGVNGQKVAWSVDDYLSSLDESFENLLKENIR